jgi:adenosylhomocysteine nucleosidase
MSDPAAAGAPRQGFPVDIGIVCALPIELATFLERCSRSWKVVEDGFTYRFGLLGTARVGVAESGMGFARARAAAQRLVADHSPGWLLSCGFAGGLTDETQIGDLVVATSVCDTHGQTLEIDVQMPSGPRLHVGRQLTVDEMVRKVEDKRRLADLYGAIAVDMESLAVAQVGRDTSTRFMSVRAISDDLSADLPAEILSIIGETGSVRFGAALGALWKRPSSAKDMWRLRENAWTAATSLANFLEGVVTQLVPQSSN